MGANSLEFASPMSIPSLHEPLPPSSPPTEGRDAFCALVSPEAPRQPGLYRLHALLEEAPAAEAPMEARRGWALGLIEWLRRPHVVERIAEEPEGLPAPESRIAALTRALLVHEPYRQRFGLLIASIAADTQGLILFAQAGIPTGHGFFAEVAARLSAKLLPSPEDETELSSLLQRAFPDEEAADWLEQVPAERIARLVATLEPSELTRAGVPLRAAVFDAVALLGTQVAARGLVEDVRVRTPDFRLQTSPFHKLPEACLSWRSAVGSGKDEVDPLSPILASCRAVVDAVNEALDERGVSVDLVYRLDRIGRELARIEALAGVLRAPDSEERWRRILALLSSLVAAARQDNSLRALLRSNTYQLARKMVESADSTGSRALTSDGAGYHAMVKSAAGGGLLLAVTASLKLLLARLSAAPFFEGLLASVNFAASFVSLQLAGFTLASVQPSMTAAALAHAVDRDQRRARESAAPLELDALVEMTQRIVRTQFAATLGNLGTAIPGAALVFFVWWVVTGEGLITPAEAELALADQHPFTSGAVLFAAFTGALLWLSSLASGWVENFIVFRRLPEAIAQHRRLRASLGEERTARLARRFRRHAATLGGGLALGVLMGMSGPVLGGFFGLPLEIRHVTLSMASVALAGCALTPYGILTPAFALALLGVVLIGALNFGVSFALALLTALRARDLGATPLLQLARAVGRSFLREPGAFFLPPRPSAPPAELPRGE